MLFVAPHTCHRVSSKSTPPVLSQHTWGSTLHSTALRREVHLCCWMIRTVLSCLNFCVLRWADSELTGFLLSWILLLWVCLSMADCPRHSVLFIPIFGVAWCHYVRSWHCTASGEHACSWLFDKIYFMCTCVWPTHVSASCVCSAFRVQKRPDSHMVVSCNVGRRTTGSSARTAGALKCWATTTVSTLLSFGSVLIGGTVWSLGMVDF